VEISEAISFRFFRKITKFRARRTRITRKIDPREIGRTPSVEKTKKIKLTAASPKIFASAQPESENFLKISQLVGKLTTPRIRNTSHHGAM
jgi:hypothetical protein